MITIKSQKEIAIMCEGGKILAEIMREIEKNIFPGKNTLELDKLAERLVFANGGKPAFKGYGNPKNPFPGTICASINDEIVHGIPSEKRVIEEGDILKIDIGLEFEGFFTDMARTFFVGEVDPNSKEEKKVINLIEVTKESFWRGVKKLKAGKNLSDYSKEVQAYAVKNGLSVIQSLVGHGIGKKLHEDPQILNYYDKNYHDMKLEAGMTLAFEPMLNMGSEETKIDLDQWTFRTKDGSLSAHYENTVLITEKGIEILTK